MPKINVTRFILGSFVAAILLFVSDGIFHERVVGLDWQAVYSRLGISPAEHTGAGVLYFAVFELGRGFVSMFLYVMMRGHFGRGPKTAALAGVIAWLAFSVTTPAQFIPLGFFSNALWIKVGIFQLITSIITTIIGASLYKDELSAAPAV
jgi:hypothetical protein